MAQLAPQSVLFLDVAFKGNDALKTNAQLEFQSHGIQFRTAVPADTELLDVRLRGGVLLIDVSKGLLELSGEVLVAAVAQIVFTGAEVESVRSVSISVDGQPQLWPAGNGDLQSDPLTIYDYPGLVPSAQPEYPAIPTPSQPGS